MKAKSNILKHQKKPKDFSCFLKGNHGGILKNKSMDDVLKKMGYDNNWATLRCLNVASTKDSFVVTFADFDGLKINYAEQMEYRRTKETAAHDANLVAEIVENFANDAEMMIIVGNERSLSGIASMSASYFLQTPACSFTMLDAQNLVEKIIQDSDKNKLKRIFLNDDQTLINKEYSDLLFLFSVLVLENIELINTIFKMTREEENGNEY